jgi:negative regulator of flagellin synthesis FlgM
MDIKINPIQAAAAAKYGEVRKSAQKPALRPAQADKVDFSGSGRLFAEALAAAKAAPDIRQARVDSTRQVWQAGEYKPDSRLIAARIIEQAGR